MAFRHPKVLAKINPSFFTDMQKVFKTERNKEDSDRYIEKLKKCEDPIIKSPTTYRNALYEFNYEKTKMLIYLKSLKYKKKFRSIKENNILTFYEKLKLKINPKKGSKINDTSEIVK
jgi:hypothetical protein